MLFCHFIKSSLRHLILLVVLLSVNGCSYIMIDHYYAPRPDGNKEMPYKVTSCEHTLFSTGPVETIAIDNDDISITVAQNGRNRSLTYISGGPFVFPVIPIFPINWFKSDNNQFLTLNIGVEIKNKRGITWNVIETAIVTPDKNRIQPITYFSYYQGKKTDLPVDDTVLELKSWGYFELRYPFTAETVSTFHLSLQGFSSDGKLLVLPDIEFHRASSWKMCGAP